MNWTPTVISCYQLENQWEGKFGLKNVQKEIKELTGDFYSLPNKQPTYQQSVNITMIYLINFVLKSKFSLPIFRNLSGYIIEKLKGETSHWMTSLQYLGFQNIYMEMFQWSSESHATRNQPLRRIHEESRRHDFSYIFSKKWRCDLSVSSNLLGNSFLTTIFAHVTNN